MTCFVYLWNGPGILKISGVILHLIDILPVAILPFSHFFLVESSQDFKFWISNYLSCPKRLLVSAFLGEIVRCHLAEIHLCLSADTRTNTRQVNWSDKYKRQLSTNPWVTGQMDFRGRGFEEGVSHKEKDGQIAFCLTLDLTLSPTSKHVIIHLYNHTSKYLHTGRLGAIKL